MVDPIELFYNVKGGRYSKSSLRNLDAITKEELVSFLNEYSGGFEINESMVECVFRRLDHDCDEQIKYIEFLEAISPFHLEKRISIEKK